MSWSTPVVVKALSGRDELVTSGTELIVAYDPKTGRELWRTTGVQSNAIPSPVFGHGLVILSAGYPAKKVIAVKLGGSRRPDRHVANRRGPTTKAPPTCRRRFSWATTST